MKNTMKTVLKKGIVNFATYVTEKEVNSTCPLIAYQPKLPKGFERLKRK